MNKILNYNDLNLNFDPWLLLGFIALIAISIVMVGSASFPIVEKYNVSEFYFILHHLYYILISLIGCFIITLIPINYIKSFSMFAVFLGFFLLLLTHIPGLSKNINGSYRWISLGFISIQPSELSKLLLIIYISGYLVRKKNFLSSDYTCLLVPLSILLVFDILLLLEPDFGSMFILSCTVGILLFIGGIRLRYLSCLLLLLGVVVLISLLTSSYRIHRIMGFLDPWNDRFNKGYQLVQSLIAFGRGGWYGLGLGNSVQKLLYLPEAYTDFIFAIIAEELGIAGVMVIIGLLTLLIVRGFKIAYYAILTKQYFSGYLGSGIATWLGLQSIVNIGVNIGILPTKGLTLPLVSYGGNSLLVCCIGMGLLFRIDFENRLHLRKKI